MDVVAGIGRAIGAHRASADILEVWLGLLGSLARAVDNKVQ